MLSFPDSYLLRGLLTLVAISLMVPGIFGVAPPCWFDHGAPEPVKQQVPAGKTDPPSTMIGQSATLVSDADAQGQTEPKAMVDGARTSGQMTETSEPVEVPAAEQQVDGLIRPNLCRCRCWWTSSFQQTGLSSRRSGHAGTRTRFSLPQPVRRLPKQNQASQDDRCWWQGSSSSASRRIIWIWRRQRRRKVSSR